MTQETLTMAQFLASAPLGEPALVMDLVERRNAVLGSLLYLRAPDIHIFCPSGICRGPRNFYCADGEFIVNQPSFAVFRTYQCRNCVSETKLFALWIEHYNQGDNATHGTLLKIGEYPLPHATDGILVVRKTDHPLHDLHPEIAKRCIPLFENNAHAEAVERSFKIVRERLRSLTGYETGSEAFGKTKLHITGAAAQHVDKDFNEGVKFLTMAIDRFRNEKAHTADGNIENFLRAYEYLRLSSLAMHLLDKAEMK